MNKFLTSLSPILLRLTLVPIVAAAVCFLSACDSAPPPPVTTRQTPSTPPVAEMRRDVPPVNGGFPSSDGSQRQRQAEFLNRLRQADPQFKTIDRALLNEQNELGLILDRTVQMDDIPALMRTMLAQMAKEFPGQDLNVIAYAPANPPLKIGTAHLNAQTRDMSYTRAQP